MLGPRHLLHDEVLVPKYPRESTPGQPIALAGLALLQAQPHINQAVPAAAIARLPHHDAHRIHPTRQMTTPDVLLHPPANVQFPPNLLSDSKPVLQALVAWNCSYLTPLICMLAPAMALVMMAGLCPSMVAIMADHHPLVDLAVVP